MTTRSSPLRERPRRYSNRPRLANRWTNRPISLSMFRLPDANELEWQTYAQFLRAIRRARAERSQADRIAIEAGDDFSVRVRFEPDVTAEPGGNRCRRGRSHSWSGTAFTHLKSPQRPLPQLAGEGGAKRRMGCGPPHESQSDCTNADASLSPTRPCFPHPGWRRLPRAARVHVSRSAARMRSMTIGSRSYERPAPDCP